MSDLYEVSSPSEHVKGYTTVWCNGQEHSNHRSWEEAMRTAYPGWQPDCSSGETCETRGDNLGLSPDY